MSDLFNRAKLIALQYFREWLPEGRQEGREWVAINPTRGDNELGSFKINIDSGAWNDFADSGACGNDCVSLYAYLNRSVCEAAAAAKAYRNHEGGVQAEAARAILERHDSSYFPSGHDSFTAAAGSGDYWAGWKPVTVPGDQPDYMPAVQYQAKNTGEFVEAWEFFSGSLVRIMIVARFMSKAGKKEDRPFTLWGKGKELKWRCKGLDDARPLWGVQALVDQPELPVLVCEGQKAASRAAGVLEDSFACVGWFGGSKSAGKTDWRLLSGRTVFFWPDADQPGMEAIPDIKAMAVSGGWTLTVLTPPVGVCKGWDIADAITDGWSKQQLIDFIRQPAAAGQPLPGTLESWYGNSWRIVGVTAADLVFLSRESRQMLRYKRTGLTKTALVTLCPLDEWRLYFGVDGKVSWDAAIDWINRQAAGADVFDHSLVRGTGAWIDTGKVIVHTGDNLIIDGRVQDLYLTDNKFVYERKTHVCYSTENLLDLAGARQLMEAVKMISWYRPASAALLCGWMTLAPFGGILSWRPHIWITGSKGVGKSYVIEHLIKPILEGIAVISTGGSTAAGIRQKLASCSLPIVIDEAESDNMRAAEKIEDLLIMLRQSSSGESAAQILHGTTDRDGISWTVSSMACLASIGAALRHGADRSRFCFLEMTGYRGTITEAEKRFAEFEERLQGLNRFWASSFHARTLADIDRLRAAVTIFREQASVILGNRRDGDQIGTLMAGSWFSEHDDQPTAAAAAMYLKAHDITDIIEVAQGKSDEGLLLDEIMMHKIDVSCGGVRQHLSIGLMVRYLSGEQDGIRNLDIEIISRELEMMGIKVMADKMIVAIAHNHSGIRLILRLTAWPDTYHDLLKRLPIYNAKESGSHRFAGVVKRSTALNLADVADEIPF